MKVYDEPGREPLDCWCPDEPAVEHPAASLVKRSVPIETGPAGVP
jgi:hypothetical protein